MKIKHNSIAWQCPECNISVKIVFETISVSTWESKIKSVEFIRTGSKRGNQITTRRYIFNLQL